MRKTKTYDEIKVDSDEDEVQFDISEKEKLESLYDFEEEDNSNPKEEKEEETEETIDDDISSGQDMFVNDSDVDSQADKEIEETNEPEIDDFEELEETNKNIDEKEKTDLYDQVEEFESESHSEDNNIDDDEELDDEEIDQNEKFKTDKDLFSFLSEREIDKIVSGIFNEDREDFANTMEKISECNSYDQSTEILKGLVSYIPCKPLFKRSCNAYKCCL